MVNMEIVKGYATLRSAVFNWLDTNSKERGPFPMEFIIALYKGMCATEGVSIYIAEYFIKEWSTLHPEAFDDRNR